MTSAGACRPSAAELKQKPKSTAKSADAKRCQHRESGLHRIAAEQCAEAPDADGRDETGDDQHDDHEGSHEIEHADDHERPEPVGEARKEVTDSELAAAVERAGSE